MWPLIVIFWASIGCDVPDRSPQQPPAARPVETAKTANGARVMTMIMLMIIIVMIIIVIIIRFCLSQTLRSPEF